MSTAANPRGLKRVCSNCGTRFYDMNNRPIICPSCETEFTGEIEVKTRRGRAANAAEDAKTAAKDAVAAKAANDEIQEEEAVTELEEVSLEDVQNAEDEDLDVDSDEADIDLGEDTLDEDLGDMDDISVLDESDEDEDLDLDVKVDKDE